MIGNKYSKQKQLYSYIKLSLLNFFPIFETILNFVVFKHSKFNYETNSKAPA